MDAAGRREAHQLVPFPFRFRHVSLLPLGTPRRLVRASPAPRPAKPRLGHAEWLEYFFLHQRLPGPPGPPRGHERRQGVTGVGIPPLRARLDGRLLLEEVPDEL